MSKPRLVVLDGHAFNPGDLSWSALEELADCEIHERCKIPQIAEFAKDAKIIVLNKPPITRDVLERLPELEFITVLATGYNVVDVQAAAELGVTVSNVPAYSTDSVAQLVFALMLELASAVGPHSRAVANGDWVNCDDFTFMVKPIFELKGKTLGIVGFGNIGRATAKIANAFGMRVVAFSRSKKQAEGVEFLPLDKVFAESDFVSLHCPLTPDTAEIAGAKTIPLMKRGAFLINTARGGLVDERILADALNSGRLGGAGLDVVSSEPPSASNPLFHAKNCVITPHMAWATFEARSRLMAATVENVRAFLSGHPTNVVNAPVAKR